MGGLSYGVLILCFFLKGFQDKKYPTLGLVPVNIANFVRETLTCFTKTGCVPVAVSWHVDNDECCRHARYDYCRESDWQKR